MTKLTRNYLLSLVDSSGRGLATAVGLIIACALTEGFGMALVLPILQISGIELGGRSGADWYAKRIDALVGSLGLRPSLMLMLSLLVAIVCARSMLTMAQSIATQAVQERFCSNLRQSLYEDIIKAHWLFICRSRSSDLVHALTSEIDRVGAATFYGIMLVSGMIIAGLYLTASFILFPTATIISLGLCIGLTLLLRRKTRAVRRGGEEYSDLTARLYAAAIEHLQGLKAARMYGAQRRNCEIFADLCESTASTSLAMGREHLSAESRFEIGSALILGASLLIAIRVVALPSSQILIILLLFARVVPRAREIQSNYRSFVGMLPSFGNVTELRERYRAAAEPASSTPIGLEVRCAIRFNRVCFTYPGAQAPLLRDIELVIPAGKTTAFVGPSGAGKSTIADLLMGLFLADQGNVLVDGVELSATTAPAWRDRIGYVSQDTFLFHDSVRANLLWAQPGARESELHDALRLAAADQFVSRLPMGLDTIVSDRGVLLSQGERQRLALARAILRRPSLLVLDEATNSLDSDNEAQILGAIDQLRSQMTVVIIAHRLSTIRWADIIYVIEAGRVVEAGDWDMLAANSNGQFRRWCSAQGLAA